MTGQDCFGQERTGWDRTQNDLNRTGKGSNRIQILNRIGGKRK